MKKNIFLLFVMLFSVTAIASQIYCDRNQGYRIMSFTQPGEKEYSVGLVNKENHGSEDENYVWDKMYGKNITSCSIFEEGFAMGAIKPVTKVSKIDASEVENIEFLKLAFDCFCKIDRELLNNCGISYTLYDNGVVQYTDNYICFNGAVVRNNNNFIRP